MGLVIPSLKVTRDQLLPDAVQFHKLDDLLNNGNFAHAFIAADSNSQTSGKELEDLKIPFGSACIRSLIYKICREDESIQKFITTSSEFTEKIPQGPIIFAAEAVSIISSAVAAIVELKLTYRSAILFETCGRSTPSASRSHPAFLILLVFQICMMPSGTILNIRI